MDWLRLYAEFSTDPKVQMMSEAMQRRLIMLFCIQCGNGIETFHETERETSLAFAMRISAEEMAITKAEFMRRGFVLEDWTLTNWGKRQYASDSSTARVRKHREAKKEAETGTGNAVKRSSNDPEQNRTEQNRAELSSTNVLEVETFGLDAPPDGETCDPSVGKRAPCPVRRIVDLYHESLPKLPKVEKITEARAGNIRARWREDLPTLDAWKNYFEDVSRSKFLTGQTDAGPGKSRPFVADLEWITKAGNFAKIAEGRYHQ